MTPKLSIVIHAEEEFDWSSGFYSNNNSVTHGDALIEVVEKIHERGGKVTLAMDYPFVTSDEGKKAIHHFKPLEGDLIEYATHLHPWVNPPFGDVNQLIDDNDSFPGNLPEAQEYAKLKTLTHKIESVAGTRPTTYLAGRYGIGENTQKILKKLSYEVDLSVSAYSDFSQSGGPNFSLRDNQILDDGDITSIPHTCSFLAAIKPIEDHFNRNPSDYLELKKSLIGKITARLLRLSTHRLSPEGFAFKHMKRMTEAQLRVGQSVFVLSFHSPSVKVGLTPYVNNKQQLEEFKRNLFRYIDWFKSLSNSQFAFSYELADEGTSMTSSKRY